VHSTSQGDRSVCHAAAARSAKLFNAYLAGTTLARSLPYLEVPILTLAGTLTVAPNPDGLYAALAAAQALSASHTGAAHVVAVVGGLPKPSHAVFESLPHIGAAAVVAAAAAGVGVGIDPALGAIVPSPPGTMGSSSLHSATMGDFTWDLNQFDPDVILSNLGFVSRAGSPRLGPAGLGQNGFNSMPPPAPQSLTLPHQPPPPFVVPSLPPHLAHLSAATHTVSIAPTPMNIEQHLHSVLQQQPPPEPPKDDGGPPPTDLLSSWWRQGEV
jgi:hypothetical protein